MKLLSKIREVITTETSIVELESTEKVTVVDYLNEKNKVIDTVIKDENGNQIHNPSMIEEITLFLDSQTNK
jgi:hypothetical protein